LAALGFHGIDLRALGSAGLYRREVWYHWCGHRTNRLPPSPKKLEGQCPALGLWQRVPLSKSKKFRSIQLEVQESFFEELCFQAWEGKLSSVPDAARNYWIEVKASGLEGFFNSSRKWSKRFGALRHRLATRSGVVGGKNSLDPHFSEGMRRWLWSPSARSRLVWVPRDPGERRIRWVSAQE